MELSAFTILGGVLLGLCVSLIFTRHCGLFGLFLLLGGLLFAFGSQSFTAVHVSYWILLSATVVHLTPIPALNGLFGFLSRLRLPRIPRTHQQHTDHLSESRENTPEAFWDGIQAPSQAIPSAQQTPPLQQKPETEKTDIPLDRNFWDVVENATNKQSSGIADKDSSDKAEADA